jgi:hypothetical protein
MRRKLGLTAVLVVALAVAGYAQKPDFSGTWTPDVDPAAAAPAGGGGGGRGGGGSYGGDRRDAPGGTRNLAGEQGGRPQSPVGGQPAPERGEGER